jgi:toxin ParE1/3/4
VKLAIFDPQARAELREAFAFHEGTTGTGERFLDAVEAACELVLQYPEGGEEYRRGVRRKLLDGFDYYLCYLPLSGGIYVVAVAHTSRRPNYWLPRIR